MAVLAAGRGTRLGSAVPKPLLALRGQPLVSWTLGAPQASGLEPVLCVVGWHARAVRSVIPTEVEVVTARHWRRGIAHSLRAALDALEHRGDVDAVVVGLADQPLVGAEAYRRLAVAHEAGALLAVATYGGQRANPVLLDRSLWGQARALRGDVGARALMTSEMVIEVDCTGTGSPAVSRTSTCGAGERTAPLAERDGGCTTMAIEAGGGGSPMVASCATSPADSGRS